MTTPNTPPDEAARLVALDRYQILDTAAEHEFDDFTALAAEFCRTPIALISLVDEHRQWFKSRVGVEETETPRDIAFCSHAIHGADVFEVPDATQDERFADNPLVQGPHQLRFYAGAPLTTPEGHNIGTLCVLDRVPRALSESQRDALRRLGRQVVARMEHRLANQQLAQQAAVQSALLRCLPAALVCSTLEGVVTSFSPGAERMLGYAAEELIGRRLTILHEPNEIAARAAELSRERGTEVAPGVDVFELCAEEDVAAREWTYVRRDGSRLPVLLSWSVQRDGCGRKTGMVAVAVDISEHRRAVQERDRMFNMSLDMLGTAGLDGFFKQINPAFVDILGYEAETFLARPFLDFVHPDDVAATSAEMEALESGATSISFENRYRCADGSWKWISWMTTPAPDGLLVATGRDVTELKRIRSALKISEQRLKVTLQSIGDGVLATDANGCITLLNPVAEALTQWSEADALGRPVGEVFKLIHSETRAPALVPVEEVLRTGLICGLPDDTSLVGRHGQETAVADSAAPIRDENGALVGVVLVFRDVTVEYAAQAQLRQTSERLRFILSATGAVVYSAQADSGRATYVSPNIEARFGYSPAEVFDEGWWKSRVHPDDLDGTLSRLERLANTGAGVHEYRFRHGDGSWRWVVDNVHLVHDETGKPELVGTLSDVTDRHLEREQAAERLRQANQGLERLVDERTSDLARSLQHKDTLLKETHHRVKNNLQIISSLLGMQADSAGSSSVRSLLTESIGRVRSMALIHERLYQSDTLARVDLTEYARALTGTLLRSYGGDKPIRLIVEGPTAEINIETAVPCGLILNELVTNALKHAFEPGVEGVLKIVVGRSAEGLLSVEVRDSGRGLPPDRPIETAASMGLQLIVALTRQLKGTLDVENDGGAVFKLAFRELLYATR